MYFIDAAKKRDENAWKHIMEICSSAVKRCIKADSLAIEEIVSTAIEKLMEQIDAYEPDKGMGNIEANFIQWINETIKFEIKHWRERNKRVHERFIFIDDLATSLGLEDFDADPHELGENIISDIVYKNEDKNPRDPQFELAKKEIVHAILEFGDEKIKKVHILHYFYGHTIEEVAEIMNEKTTNINNWIHRNKNALRIHLSEKGIDTMYLENWDYIK
ncbi:MAG: sigma-70 family RNA polymerase sigma factor [Syntrophorhabdaceae bacterium]|nr:sigma-70 family RNA polymerase sigma factor [Syntrophorhabdaceae bacterium]